MSVEATPPLRHLESFQFRPSQQGHAVALTARPLDPKEGNTHLAAFWTGLVVIATAVAGGWAAVSTAQAADDDKGPVAPRRTTKPTTLFNNFNSAGVVDQARSPTTFTLSAAKVITTIQTYHWNSGRGKAPGTIKLVSSRGQSFGPWQASGSDGQGGVKNAFWTVTPSVSVPAGTYTVVDSNPPSWSNNSESGFRGFAKVDGR